MRTLSVGLFGLLVVVGAVPACFQIAPSLEHSSAPSAAPCELTNEDYSVYSAVLNSLGTPEDPEEEWRNKSDFILSDRTVDTQDADSRLWGFRSNSKQAPSPQTIRNFDGRVKGVCVVQPLFKAKNPVRLVSGADISDFFKKKGDGWKKFYAAYPKSSGYWDFSPVGYSDDGLEALVYVGHHCGYLCGTGHLVLLAKESGIWVVKNRTMLWIS